MGIGSDVIMGYKMKEFSGFTDGKFNVSKSNIEGVGVIASKSIKKGELIGTAIDDEAGVKSSTQLDTRTILGRSLNHQDGENAIQKSEDNSLNVYAKKSIKKGEEITINYNNAPSYVTKNTEGYKEI